MELMIVMAIVGILAGIAIPSYRNTLNKAKILEATTLMHRVKLNVNDYALHHHGDFTLASTESLGLTHLALGANYVQSIKINVLDEQALGVLITLKQHLGQLTYQGRYLMDSGQMHWACHFGADDPIRDYAPKTCTPSQP